MHTRIALCDENDHIKSCILVTPLSNYGHGITRECFLFLEQSNISFLSILLQQLLQNIEKMLGLYNFLVKHLF